MLEINVVMIGATGAVGGNVVKALLASDGLSKLTLLGRREMTGIDDVRVAQHVVDVLQPSSYQQHIAGHNVAICTLGVGEPSKVSREQFVCIDKTAPLDFASECKVRGIEHFELLSSVATSAQSRSFFLRAKGELEEALQALAFQRLSIFQPSMIITEQNRYGFSQALTLALWPMLSHLMLGPLKPYRGIDVRQLGTAMARNALISGEGVERLTWSDFRKLNDA